MKMGNQGITMTTNVETNNDDGMSFDDYKGGVRRDMVTPGNAANESGSLINAGSLFN